MSKIKNSTTLKDDMSANPKELPLHQEEDENGDDEIEMDNVSSDQLFMIDCVGNTSLKSKFEEKEDSESELKEKSCDKDEVNDDDVDDDDDTSENYEEHKQKIISTVLSWVTNKNYVKKSQETKPVEKNNNKKNSKYTLACSIDPHLENILPKNRPTVNRLQLLETTKPAPDPCSEIISQRKKKKNNKERRDMVCSDKWFNMKAPELTKDVKNQLSILQLREILDRKNFYKNNDRKKFPKFFQMGKVVESAADFYHARVPKKQRKATLLDEVMADADMKKYQKRKYAEIFGNAKKSNKKKRKQNFASKF